MKYYRLAKDCFEFKAGSIFNFNAKHLLMAQLSFAEQRNVLWEEATANDAMMNSYFGADGNSIVLIRVPMFH
jgi:hypothetical protein